MMDDLAPGDLLADRDHLRMIVVADTANSDDMQYLRCSRSSNTAMLYISVRRAVLDAGEEGSVRAVTRSLSRHSRASRP